MTFQSNRQTDKPSIGGLSEMS